MRLNERAGGKIRIQAPNRYAISGVKRRTAGPLVRAGASAASTSARVDDDPSLPLQGMLRDEGLTLVDSFEVVPPAQGLAASGLDAIDESVAVIDVSIEADERVVVMTEQDSVLEWRFPSAMGDQRAGTRRASSAAGGRRATFVIPLNGASDTSGRAGSGGTGLFSRIRAFVYRFVAKKAVDFAMARLEQSVEEGLVLIDGLDPQAWAPSDDVESRVKLPGDRPARILLMVHGTFSSTMGSFGALTEHDAGREFLKLAFARYDAVLGFDHKTLSKTPDENAAEFLAKLDWLENSERPPVIHAIAYSRGGLVLRAMTELLWDSDGFQASFEKAVAVGCTNAGTYLAAPENWESLINVYTNFAGAGLRLLGAATGSSGALVVARQILKGVGSLVKHIVNYAVEERAVPGLAAMDPDGDYIRRINVASTPSESVKDLKWYAVIGDFEPSANDGKLGARVATWLADRVVDRLMGQLSNDLVVHTASMTSIDPELRTEFAGIESFGRSDGVCHVEYFAQGRTASFLCGALGLAAAASAPGMATTRAPVIRLAERLRVEAMPDRVDLRDFPYQPSLRALPNVLVNIDKVPVVLDQGREGACTGFALAAVVNYLHANREGGNRRVSPHMLYAMARKYDEWPGESYEGSSARGAMKGWVAHGACADTKWPTKGHTLTPKASEDALQSPGGAYFRVKHREIRDMHAAINETGILFATLMVHKGWENPRDAVPLLYSLGGNVQQREIAVIRRTGSASSGHAVAIVGYTSDGFIIQNSWGVDWGTGGFALLPYEDYLIHAMDVWVAQLGVVTRMNLFELGAADSRGDETAGMIRAADHVPLASIRPYMINVGNNGKLSTTGKYWTSEEDIRVLFRQTIPAQMKRWSVEGKPPSTRRILLYLHGGLNKEDTAARRVIAYRDVLLANEIYPLHIMWETGAGETLLSMIADAFTAEDERAGSFEQWMATYRDHLTEARDRALEMTLSLPGTAIWNEMKENARLASAHADGGMRLLANEAAAAIRKAGGGAALANWEIHIVAHSAGAIFAAHALPEILRLGLRVQSIQFFAPAITVDLFRQTVWPLVTNKACPKPILYLLDEKTEKADSVKLYRKSLLYLVSNAFESKRKKPLLGLLESVRDPKNGLAEAYKGAPDLIVAGSQANSLSTSTTHGGFDSDVATLNSMLRVVMNSQNLAREFVSKDLGGT